MNEAGTVEPGAESIQQLIAQNGGGVLYAFTLRPKRFVFQLAVSSVLYAFSLRPQRFALTIALQEVWGVA
jgi:hypothetical protein